jgi:hypothetical protein
MHTVVFLLILLAVVLVARLVRQTAGAPTVPPPKRGALDDDGVNRGERWDGSWLSGPLTAAC